MTKTTKPSTRGGKTSVFGLPQSHKIDLTGQFELHQDSTYLFEESLTELKVDGDSFRNWITKHIREWLAERLIPLIVDENKRNITELNSLVSHFGKKLREVDLFEKQPTPSNPGMLGGQNDTFSSMNQYAHYGGFPTNQNKSLLYNNMTNNTSGTQGGYYNNQPSMDSYTNNNTNNNPNASNPQLQTITIDQLLQMSQMNGSKGFGAVWSCINVKSAHQVNEIYRSLETEIKRRKFLDCYLKISGYTFSDIRAYVLSRLINLERHKFYQDSNKDAERSDGQPSDKEIFLGIFVFFIIENDTYYRGGTSVDSILLDPKLNWLPKKDSDFYVK